MYFSFYRHQGPCDLLQGLIISCCIDSSFGNFWIKFSFFSNFLKIFVVFQVYGSLSPWNYFRLQTGILNSLLRQWNGSGDINILIFSKSLWKFAIVSKIFQCFLSFSEFNDHYRPLKIYKSWRWVTWQNFQTKNGFLLLLRIWKLIYIYFCLLNFFIWFIY